jgi:Na+/H+ antiporter NhaD/arsenite permease-like protein
LAPDHRDRDRAGETDADPDPAILERGARFRRVRPTARYRERHDQRRHELQDRAAVAEPYSVFTIIARAEWDTLLFFYGVFACVGGLAAIGYLALASQWLYGGFGFTVANSAIGVLSAVVDNIPIMFAVLKMDPAMDHGQWLLVTLTAGVGGSLLSIGSAAGVALMGASRGLYTFTAHLRWSFAIALGYVASIAVHLWLNARHFTG